MKYLVVTQATKESLENFAEANDWVLRTGGHRICSGHWEFPIDDDVAEGLARLSDDPDEAIRMLLTGQYGRA